MATTGKGKKKGARNPKTASGRNAPGRKPPASGIGSKPYKKTVKKAKTEYGKVKKKYPVATDLVETAAGAFALSKVAKGIKVAKATHKAAKFAKKRKLVNSGEHKLSKFKKSISKTGDFKGAYGGKGSKKSN